VRRVKNIAHDLPLTAVNQPRAPHAFDLFDDSEASGETVRTIVVFLRRRLAGAS
jgi:hypothetical protein